MEIVEGERRRGGKKVERRWNRMRGGRRRRGRGEEVGRGRGKEGGGRGRGKGRVGQITYGLVKMDSKDPHAFDPQGCLVKNDFEGLAHVTPSHAISLLNTCSHTSLNIAE